MVDRKSTEFHKWGLLPKEIQFDILDLNVMISHHIYLELHRYYFEFTILPLLLFDRSVSNHVKKRYYFKNRFLVSCSGEGVVSYPKPEVGSFISEIQLTLRADTICNLNSFLNTYVWSFLPRHPSKAALAHASQKKHNHFVDGLSHAKRNDCDVEATETSHAIENEVADHVNIRDLSNGVRWQISFPKLQKLNVIVDFGDDQPTAETRLYPRLCAANQTRNLTLHLRMLDLRPFETNQWAWLLSPSSQWEETVTALERLTIALSFKHTEFDCNDFHQQFDKLRETMNLHHFANRPKRVRVIVKGIKCCQFSYKHDGEQGDACVKLCTKLLTQTVTRMMHRKL